MAYFIPFIMAGYPTLDMTLPALLALAEAGADFIELGVPFSDPIADGPVNQHAAEVAIKNGATLEWCLQQVKALRERDCFVPVVLFSYFNPILAMGIDKFLETAKEAGVNHVLVVDLPLEADSDFYELLLKNGITPILIVSPTTELIRVAKYKRFQPPFLYYISRLGVTGLQNDLPEGLEQNIQLIKESVVNIPIAVGFGISTLEQAKKVAAIADGVIVGSLFVKTLGEEGVEGLKQLAKVFSTGAYQPNCNSTMT